MQHAGAATDLTGATPVEESRSLTGLRALAALLVMVHHFYLHLALDQHLPVLQWLLRRGYMGVDLFFVLSGFVMSMVYGRWFDDGRSWRVGAYARFVVRRVARLWPMHATILAFILLTRLSNHALTGNLIFANFAMIQAWGLSAAINPPAWSVSTEFFAYLAFPFLAPVVLRPRIGAVVCIACIAAALAMSFVAAPPLGPGRRGLLDLYFNYSLSPLFRCMAGFMAGMLGWRARDWPVLRTLADTTWFGPGLLLVFLCMLLGRVNDLLIFPVLPLIVLGLYRGDGPGHRMLAANPLRALGTLSYATYLLHYMLLSLFPFQLMRLSLGLPIYYVSTIGLAALLHWLIEQPGRRLIRQAGDGLLQRAMRLPLQDRAP